ncbi:MAG: DbpA RNA binding domain-containing protein [Treponema sp.]|jgi:hypothetical protein|nr:DbpA RNA binding domain-containing protein [Treponema sp.]
MATQFDPERLKKRISETLEKVYNEADPALLARYRSILKKEVGFFRRSYFAAYLLMEFDRSGGRPYRDRFTDRPRRDFRQDGSEQPALRDRSPHRSFLSEEESVRLFFGAGRTRRVFPREILGIIGSRTQVPREDIGAIRILDNYSFVQVRSTVADDIIEALNGKPFRGRPLSVNYARSKRDEDWQEDSLPPESGEDTGATTAETVRGFRDSLAGEEILPGDSSFNEAGAEPPEESLDSGEEDDDR